MRWRGLFEDLEAQYDAAQAAELAAEVAERSRREAALLRLGDRLLPAVGASVQVHLPVLGAVRGVLQDCGVDWVLLEEPGGCEVLVPLDAVVGVVGAGARASGQAPSAVAKRLDLRWALRGLARSRTPVTLALADGTAVHGTLDRVGADHLDLAEHGREELRRAAAVRQVRLVPLRAVVAVRSD